MKIFIGESFKSGFSTLVCAKKTMNIQHKLIFSPSSDENAAKKC
jgi:hypothetical protein